MSCQLSVLSRFQDIAGVRNFLFPHLKDKSPPPAGEQYLSESSDTDPDWGEDWDWTAEDKAGPASLPPEHTVEAVEDGVHKWLQASVVSLSPNNDIIVLANEDRICVLTQKWDPQNKGEDIDTRLASVWQSSIKQDEGELITAVICLPLASQKRSTQGAPDWTCVVVGFSSGYVRMYNETGVLLLSQLLHVEPVQKLKCRTYEPPRFIGMSEKHEELAILYKKAVVCIDGFSLIQSLRACMNQVARAAASGGESNYVQPPPLAYKKWALNDQEKISDLVTCGVTCPNPFDQLKNASMQGGFAANPRTNPPAASVYLTSGAGPYVGFFYAIEGSTQPILSEVAMAMAHKLKSALLNAASGWLGFGGKQKEETKDKPPKIEPAAPLPLRFGLPDKRRSADSLILSPCNNYIATTDSFGRVILVDAQRGIAVRMWKGYRDAQVGWIQVKEDDDSQRQQHSPSHSRVAQFLIIYAPRRGILEVWTAVNGPRVAAFNVSKHCVLVCPSYGLMGLNNVTYRGIKSPCTFHCALVDPVDCSVKTLDIPFHLALSDKSSKRARDLHLLKKLKATLKESNVETETLKSSVKEVFLDIRIASISHQAMERILSTRYLSVNFMQEVVQSCIVRLSSKGEDNLDIDSKMLLRFAHMETGLLETYAAVLRLTLSSLDPNEVTPVVPDSEILQFALGMSKKESDYIAEQLQQYNAAVQGSKSTVRVDARPAVPLLAATSFLHAFSARSHASVSDEHGVIGKPAMLGTICIAKDVTEERRKALAHLLFNGCLTGVCQAEDIGMVLQESNLAPDQLMKLLLLHCLSLDHMDLSAALSLKILVRTITAMTDMSEVLVDQNETSAWWQRVRDACSQSEQNCAAFITALVCRKIAYEFAASQTEAKDPDADTASDKADAEAETDNDRATEKVSREGQKSGKGGAEAETDNDRATEKVSREGQKSGKGGDETERSTSDLSSWESVTVEMAYWELLLKQLEDALALSTLLHITIPRSEIEERGGKVESNKEPIRMSVSKLLDGGKGSISELVACYVANQGLGAESLFKMPVEDEDPNQGQGQEDGDPNQGQGQEDRVLPKEIDTVRSMTSLERLQSYLKHLRKRFPSILDNDLLISNCGWEYGVLWNKDVEEVKNLQCSLDYLKLVQNAVLRQGVSSMLWHMFVAKRVSAAAQLMDKVGKAPKDRLCRKEVIMSDKSLTAFCGCVVDLLNIIMEANCEANEVPVFNTEHNWQGVRGPASLAELAVDGKTTNYGLVRLHWQLAIFMHAVMQFNLKGVKVLSLFERRGRAALFKDLNTHPLLPSKTVDEGLAKERQTALARIITNAIEALGEPHLENKGHHKRPSMFTLYWPRICMSLATDLGVDEEYIRRLYIVDLYNYGHDELAHTIHGFITDQEKFGRQLLLVAGRRMAYRAIHENPKEMPRFLGEMTPGLSYWLKSMDMEKLPYKTSPLSDTLKLLGEVTRRLEEASKETELALELMEFTELLITLKISAETKTESP